jgi:hypothetical protein
MSDCGCVYIDVDETSETICQEIRKARKTHKCEECNREIIKGEKYEYLFSKYDGSTDVHKTCLDCLSIRKTFFCDGWYYGQLWEALFEHIRDMDGRISSSCLVDLTPRARERVCEQIEEVWEDLGDDEG